MPSLPFAIAAPPPDYIAGILAAAATAACWGSAAMFFSAAARRMGHFHVNQIRLVLAIAFLAAICAVQGLLAAPPQSQMILLALSGVAGLVMGDGAYFICLTVLGPRRGVLLLSLAPAFTAALAVPMLGESLNLAAVAGMGVTLAGVLWVALEQSSAAEVRGSVPLGILCGVIGSIGQALGLVLAKVGLGTITNGAWLCTVAGLDNDNVVQVHALPGTLVRMLAGGVLLVGFGLLRGSAITTLGKLRDGRGMAQTIGGTIFGPVVGVTLSLFAVTQTDAAVAATIFATAPVVVIPLVVIFGKQRVSFRAVFGALIAIAGVAMLAFKDQIGW